VPLGQLEILTPPTLALAGSEYYFSTKKAQDELGWKPLFTVDEGMKNTAEYFKSLKEASRIKAEAKKEK
jgi:nucleoside-diphosphate-sugar epimerase